MELGDRKSGTFQTGEGVGGGGGEGEGGKVRKSNYSKTHRQRASMVYP